jgi:hypothetical protein
MAAGSPDQFWRRNGHRVFAAALVGYAGWYAAGVFRQPPGNDPSAPAVRETGFPVAWLWAWGWPVALGVRNLPPDRPGVRAEPARVVYTLGCGLCLLHIAVAFHLGHGWSHRAAYRHTAAASGFGPGVFVNYLFAAVWAADVVWAWAAFDRYLARPHWVSWAVHGFMGSVVVNAAVVFGSGPQRIASAAFLAVPAALAWWAWRRA